MLLPSMSSSILFYYCQQGSILSVVEVREAGPFLSNIVLFVASPPPFGLRWCQWKIGLKRGALVPGGEDAPQYSPFCVFMF